jgi:hypothetical protein
MVERAFRNLTIEFQKAVACKKIDADHPYLSELKAYRGMVNYKEAYGSYSRAIGQAVVYKYMPQLDLHLDKRFIFNNFDQFTDQVMLALERIARVQPITLSGFMRSRFSMPHISALVVDIADLDNSVDQEKYDTFINSRNYQFFLTAAKQHGFHIDRFVPWRLYLDVNCDVTVPKMYRYHNQSSPDSFFRANYNRAHIPGYELFKRFLLNIYYTYHDYKPFRGDYSACTNGSTVSRVERLLPTPRSLIFSRKDELYFLKLYAKIRNIEEEGLYSRTEVDDMANQAYQRHMLPSRNGPQLSRYNMANGLLYLESRLSRNHTKQGSLTSKEIELRLINEAKDVTIRRRRQTNMADVVPHATGPYGAMPGSYDYDHHADADFDDSDLGYDPYETDL